MRHIYPITFYLRFGALLLCMPLSCSASQNPLDKHIVERYFPLFQQAMKVYMTKRLPENPAADLEALKEIKSCLAISLNAYAYLASSYVYSNFSSHKIFPKEVLPIISGYIKKKEDEDYYQQRKKLIAQWGLDYCYYTFCAECIADEAKYGRLYTTKGNSVFSVLKHYFDEHMDVFAKSQSTTISLYNNMQNMEPLLLLLLDWDSDLAAEVPAPLTPTSNTINPKIDSLQKSIR